MHEHSAVWLAKHNSLGVNRIIKGIRKDSPFYDRLIREARLMINLNHPGIPIIYDVEDDYNYTCIIEQYIEGESLGALCSRRLLSEKELYSFILRIGSVIEYLHGLPESIIFLDLKPENVIISGGEAWLVDFASAVSKAPDSTVTALSASPGYTAPEQESNMAVDKNADMYALGRLLDYMADHSSIDSDKRRQLKRIAGRCAREYPWNRISSPGILLKMLNRQRKAETTSNPIDPDKNPDHQYRRIGVLGLKPGEGATTVAIALAHSLSKLRGGRVVLIEKSDHADLSHMYGENTAEDALDTGCYSLNGVNYAASGTVVNETALTEDAEYVVFDLGSSVKRAAGTLTNCDLCIAVAGAAPWRRQLYHFLDRPEYKDLAGLNWMLVINRADRNAIKDIANCGIPMEVFTFIENPAKPDKDTIGLFERAMR